MCRVQHFHAGRDEAACCPGHLVGNADACWFLGLSCVVSVDATSVVGLSQCDGQPWVSLEHANHIDCRDGLHVCVQLLLYLFACGGRHEA